ncbi:uncharacterized protein LOC144136631 [Amblyomma americanum]
MMKQFPWTAASTKTLIVFFREHENLYNPRHKLYKNRMLRDKHLATLSAIIGCTPEEAKARFRNLRTYFFRENQKVAASKKSVGPGGVPYCSMWEFFDDMTFLRHCHHPRSPATALTGDLQGNDETDAITVTDEASNDADDAPEADGCNREAAPESPAEDTFDSMSNNAAEALAVLSQEPPQKKWRRQFERVELRREEMEHSHPVASWTDSAEDPKDENFYFAMMLAQELRQLEPVKRDMLKVRLLEEVFQAKHNVVFGGPSSSSSHHFHE